ncbi:aldo/keto reductase [Streptomyces sp. IB2014 016-6]|nr:aldo/keto reductase [Streptomyces sp. IB2014 016-6]
MRRRHIGGPAGPLAGALCLGAMPFGTSVDEKTSFAILDRFVEAGGNLIDTANNYAFWLPGGTGDESETTVGRWMASRGVRDEVLISTKSGARPTVPGTGLETAEGLSAGAIREAAADSLRRLGTDRIDLYWTHIEDRSVPLEETLGALDGLVRTGRAGLVGCSNHAAWRTARARDLSRANGWAAYTCVQQRQSYLQPRFDTGLPESGHTHVTPELLDYVRSEPDLTLMAYSSLISGAYTRDDKPLPAAYDHRPVLRQVRQPYIAPGGATHHVPGRAPREMEQQMESGGGPRHPVPGQPFGDLREKAVAPPAVPQPGGAQMPVVRPRLQEPGERGLVDHGRRRPHGVRRVQPVEQTGRHDGPADPQGGRQRLAERAEQGDTFGIRALEGPDGVAVVAELRVVVVLHDQPVHLPCPVDEFGAAGRGEDDTGRELVGGRDDHRAHVRLAAQQVDAEAVVVHGYGDGCQARRRDGGAQPRPARILQGHVGVPGGAQGTAEPEHPVQCSAAHDELSGVERGAPPAYEIGGDPLPQPVVTGGVGIAELGGGEGAGRLPYGVGPPLAGERAQVGHAGQHVELRFPGRVPGPSPVRRRGPGRRRTDTGGRPAPRLEVPLGDELRVRLRHHPAGAAEIGGERPAGRQSAAGSDTAVHDGRPEGPDEPQVQGACGPFAQVELGAPGGVGRFVRHRGSWSGSSGRPVGRGERDTRRWYVRARPTPSERAPAPAAGPVTGP